MAPGPAGNRPSPLHAPTGDPTPITQVKVCTRTKSITGFSLSKPVPGFKTGYRFSGSRLTSLTTMMMVCSRPTKAGWRPGRSRPEPRPAETPGTPFPNIPTTASLFEGMSRIDGSVLHGVWENAGKRQIGKGFIGFLTDAEYRQSRLDANVRQQMVALHHHRYIVCIVTTLGGV